MKWLLRFIAKLKKVGKHERPECKEDNLILSFQLKIPPPDRGSFI